MSGQKFQNLTIKNNFMFDAVMAEPENCKGVVELVLGMQIDHVQMDMEMLLAGHEYKELPNSYVIFICDFDPFGKGKYRYTFQSKCKENTEVELEDFQDPFVKRLQESICWIKSNREMEERFMIFEEMMRDEREAGKLEGQMEAKQNTALNMHQKGYTDETIAEVLEVDVQSIRKWISEAEPAIK